MKSNYVKKERERLIMADEKTAERLATLEVKIEQLEKKFEVAKEEIKETIQLYLAPICKDTDAINKYIQSLEERLDVLEERVKAIEVIPAKKSETRLAIIAERFLYPLVFLVIVWILGGRFDLFNK